MILEALKTKTATSHANLEASPLMAPIRLRNLTLTSYAQILRSFYGFFSPLEGLLDTNQEIRIILPDYTSRRKANSILQDLSVITGLPADSQNVPFCKDLPIINNTSQVLGALYVTEGSTLGGKFISRIISDTLGLTADNGTSFFSGYGSQTGEKWKTFQQTLTQYSTSKEKEEEVVSAADETFRKLEKWFNY